MSGNAAISQVLAQYLVRTALPKLAAITNCLPARDERNHVLPYLNYICFCLDGHLAKAEALFLAYLYGYRKLDYDVIVSSLQDGLVRRQFGYVHLRLRSLRESHECLQFLAGNKAAINRKYPVFVRVQAPGCAALVCPQGVSILLAIDDGDAVFEVGTCETGSLPLTT